MNLQIEITELELKELIIKALTLKLGEVKFSNSDIVIEVKSKQNFKSEWECANFRARACVSTQS